MLTDHLLANDARLGVALGVALFVVERPVEDHRNSSHLLSTSHADFAGLFLPLLCQCA